MHLAEVIGMLGHPPSDLLKRAGRSDEFFTKYGMRCLMTKTILFQGCIVLTQGYV
jgi:hypothetical protein